MARLASCFRAAGVLPYVARSPACNRSRTACYFLPCDATRVLMPCFNHPDIGDSFSLRIAHDAVQQCLVLVIEYMYDDVPECDRLNSS